MRFILAVFVIWFAICLVPDGRSVTSADTETEQLYHPDPPQPTDPE